MSQAMGVLNAIVGSGNMRMQDLTDAMSTGVLSAAKVFGVSIQSVGAAIATMTNAGIPAVDAATKLNSAMRLLAAPTSKAAKELKTIGLSSTALAADLRTPGGILTAMQDLQTHMTKAGLTAIQQGQFIAAAFGGKQSLGVMTLLGSLTKLGAIQAQVTKGAGTFDAAWKATEATTKEQGAQVDASISTVKDAIGIGLLPAVNGLLHSVLPMVQGLAMWAAANPGLASQILLVTGGVAALIAGIVFLGPILGAIGALIGAITSPILLVGAAIVGLAAHFGLLGQGAKSFADGILGTIAGMVPGVISSLRGLADQIISWIGSMVGPILAQLGAWADAFVAWIGPMIPKAIVALGNLASQAIAWVSAQVPIFLARLLTWADLFVGWIGPMIPVALSALADFGARLVGWVLAEIPILAAGIGMLAGELVNWILPKIPGLLTDLAQFGLSLINWIATEATVVAGAMADLAFTAVTALGSALVSDPSLIVKGIGLLLGGVLVVAAAQAAATIVGTAYTIAMRIAATAASTIGAFASAIAAAIIAQLTTMGAAGGIVGTAIGAAMKIGALAAEGFGSIGSAIAGVIGDATPVVTAAAATQGTVAGAAGALTFGAALTAGLIAAAVAAVAATWVIINNGLNAQAAAVQSRLTQVLPTQTTAQLQQDKAAILTGLQGILDTPGGTLLWGDQFKALHAQLDQVNAQIANVTSASASAAKRAQMTPALTKLVAIPDLVSVPDKALPKLVSIPDKAAPSTASQLLAGGIPKQTLIDAGLLPGKKTVVPSAAAIASAPVAAATTAAAQAATAAQIHLESMKVQLQTAELAANAGNAAAAQQVLVLKAEIAHQQAADAVAAAQGAVTVAETAVKASHDKLALAQAGRIKGVNIIATSEAAYQLAQDKLALATAKLTVAQGSAALQAQAAVSKAGATPLGFLEPAGGITGAGGALGMTTGATTAPSGTSAVASSSGLDWDALRVLASAIRAWMSNGVPITLDGQTIGDMIDRQAYQSAATATSGFVAQGSIA
jgi:hypothetical protein